jgi:hypothetical protein
MLITHHGRLIAAVELKSQVGPSFGNNFNNRAEEAIGTATDLWTAFREGALGSTRPFVGWLILVEDCPKSRAPGQRLDSPHFPVRPEFLHASYLDRYALLCTKLVRENLYTHAAVIASPRDTGTEGTYHDLTDSTSFTAFAKTFTAHIAAT